MTAMGRTQPHISKNLKIAAIRDFRTHGGPCCQGAWWSDPVTCVFWAPGWGDCCCGFSSSLLVCAGARSGVKLERPQAR
jgi:hypothetical protein